MDRCIERSAVVREGGEEERTKGGVGLSEGLFLLYVA